MDSRRIMEMGAIKLMQIHLFYLTEWSREKENASSQLYNSSRELVDFSQTVFKKKNSWRLLSGIK